MTQRPKSRQRQPELPFTLSSPPGAAAASTAAEAATPPHTSKPWLDFVRAFEQVLAVLENGQFLVLEHTRSSAFVQLAVQGATGLRVEAVSDPFLKPGEKLGERGCSLLRRLGWRPPTFVPDRARGTRVRPGESPNYFTVFPVTAPLVDAANLAVATLRLVYGVAHPTHLVYRAFAADGSGILLPTLGLNHSPRCSARPDEEVVGTRPHSRAELQAAVLEALTETLGLPNLAFNDTGSLSLSFEGPPVFLHVGAHEAFVDLQWPLVRGVDRSSELLAALNEINCRHRFMTFSHTCGDVVATANVDCNPFVPEMLLRLITEVGKTAARVAPDLHARFGGELSFDSKVEGAGDGPVPERLLN